MKKLVTKDALNYLTNLIYEKVVLNLATAFHMVINFNITRRRVQLLN